MFGFDWQNVVALAIVAAAVTYLTRSVVVSMRSRKSGCGAGCSSCSATEPEKESAAGSPIVSLEQLTASGRHLHAKSSR